MLGFIPEELAILDNSPLSSGYAETFAYSPSKNEESLGSRTLAAQIFSNKRKNQNARLVSEIANTIKNEYYKNTIVAPISAMRFALKRANNLLSAQRNWLNPAAGLKLKIIAAVLKERNLHLAKMGPVAALILRNDNLQSIIAPTPRLAGAQDAAISPDARVGASWSFENIVSGELLESDTIVLATNQIHKIDEAELVYKLKHKELGKYLKNYGEGVKSLAMVALYPKKTSAPITPLAPPLIEKPNKPYKSYPPAGRAGRTNRTYTKPILLVLVIAAMAVAVAAVAVKIKRETAQNRAEAETLLAEVSGLKEKIADLIEVKNETEANELLASATQKLERLAQLGLFKTTQATLSRELNETAQGLLKLEEIKNISPVLILENNSADFEPKRISLGRNKIIVFGGNAFYRFDLNRKIGGLDSLETGDVVTAVMEKPDYSDIALAATQDKIMEYGNSPEPKIVWARSESQTELSQAALYRDAFYFLAKDGLVYKLPYEVSSTTSDIMVGEISLWTKDSGYRLQATGFAVEGSIFALADEHTIVELANGQKKNETFLKETVAEIFTLSNHKNTYALAPAEGLIVVLDKNLNLKKRISHPELRGAKSFVVNSQERIVYFLKDKIVYSFEI